MKKLTMHNAQLTIIIAIVAATILTACTNEELGTDASSASPITIAPPPAWQTEDDTRATLDLANLKTEWQTNDQMELTATYHHQSGLTQTQTATIAHNGTAWPVGDIIITWPVGDITHADITATITGVNNPITGVNNPGTGRLNFQAKATGVKPGEAINLTFTHLSAAIQFKDLMDGDEINIPALGITNSTERLFYFTPPAGGKLSGTVTDSNDGNNPNKPFTIDLGTSPVGKLHYIKPGGHTGGTTTPDVLVETNRFMAWRNSSDVLTTNFTLQCDIDLTGVDWTPIGGGTDPDGNTYYYTGTFNGGGHTISGLKITANTDCRGLFGYTGDGAVLANVTIKNPVITGGSYNYIGALVGFAIDTTISHCAVVGGTVTGNARVGGLVGWADNTHIAGCYTAGTTVKGNHNVGGLVGHTYYNTHIAACYATDVTVTGSNSGGLVGFNEGGTIAFCYTNQSKLLGYGTSLAGTYYDGSNPASDALKDYEGTFDINVWNNATKGKESKTLTSTIWNKDFTLDMDKLK